MKVKIDNIEIDTELSPIIIKGERKYSLVRLYYYLIKTFYLLPRLYGIKVDDPLLGWKNEFERQFKQILSNELSLAKLYYNSNFEIETRKFTVLGQINAESVSVEVKLKEIPQLDDRGIRGLMKVDSFYFSDLEKKRPYIIPAIRSGLIASFYRFLPFQFEGAPGIPKTLGLISEFINSMLLPQGYKEEILGHKIYVKENDLYCDEDIIYNADPEILSIFPIVFYLKNSSENNIVIIEEPEAHLTDKGINYVRNLLNSSKAKIVIASDYFSNNTI